MPRRSGAFLALPYADLAPSLPRPPTDAPAGVQQLFAELLAMAPRDHFRPSDMPLLEQYCQACLLARAAFEEITANGPVIDGKPSPWVAILAAAHKSSAALAARLRLAPQARATARTTGRNQNARAPSAFDLMRLEAEHSD